jgi:hypothetical protein
MKATTIDWDDLHDAVLEEISVTWEELARVTFKMLPNEAYIKPRQIILLEGEGLRSLVCPQKNPWGPSDLVNSISEEGGGDYKRLDIEMQSGDVIRVEAESFDVLLK